MNTNTDTTDFLPLGEMAFFPDLDLCLPQFHDGSDDLFHLATKENEDFSTGEILQELDLEGI